MGSHLADALVLLGARVRAFVRATSSGALNNIGHLRGKITVDWGDLTDRHSVDRIIRALADAPDPPYVFHLAAQAHVGESWHRPYETVMTNTVGTLNLLQSVVDHGLELEKFNTAGTSEEYGNIMGVLLNLVRRAEHDTKAFGRPRAGYGIAAIVATLAFFGWSGAAAAQTEPPPPPDDGSAIDEYVEEIPTSSGGVAPGSG
jgi:GDP-D-mannose dehydratase